jgi:ferric-dicitrate binding protein FerR (iron transport regulator)
MKRDRVFKIISSLVLVCTTTFFLQPGAFAVNPGVLGDVVPSGNGGVIETDGKTTAIKKSEPLFSKSTFSTQKDGKLSFSMSDGTRLELGSNSRIFISGSAGELMVTLMRGELAFHVPKDSSLMVQTTEVKMEIPGFRIKEERIGLISRSEKKTQVNSEQGDIVLRSIDSDTELMKITSGESVTLETQTQGDREVLAVQKGELEKTGEGLSSQTKLLLYIGGAVVAGGAIAAMAGGGGGGGGGGGSSPPASPSSP